jgi:hypothetical protein
MPTRKLASATSLAIALLERLATCREQLRVAAEQLRQSPYDSDASRIAQETIDFLMQWIKSFQVAARCAR